MKKKWVKSQFQLSEEILVTSVTAEFLPPASKHALPIQAGTLSTGNGAASSSKAPKDSAHRMYRPSSIRLFLKRTKTQKQLTKLTAGTPHLPNL